MIPLHASILVKFYNQHPHLSKKTRRLQNGFGRKNHVWYFIFIPVSGQVYDSHTFHETVIHGNDAIFKCSIPSFVSDFVAVLGWVDSQGLELGNPTGIINHLNFI